MSNRMLTFLTVSLVAGSYASIASAQDVPGHPRVNEIDQRLQNQTNRTDAGVANGQINARQEARDQRTDAKVARQESRDEAVHGGHLTKAEQTHMNEELNNDSTRIHDQKTNQ